MAKRKYKKADDKGVKKALKKYAKTGKYKEEKPKARKKLQYSAPDDFSYRYQRYLEETQKKAKRYGDLNVYPLSEQEFKAEYNATKNDIAQSGKRSSSNQIISKLARRTLQETPIAVNEKTGQEIYARIVASPQQVKFVAQAIRDVQKFVNDNKEKLVDENNLRDKNMYDMLMKLNGRSVFNMTINEIFEILGYFNKTAKERIKEDHPRVWGDSK